MKHKTFRPALTTRELSPKLRQTNSGIQILCPFCTPSHPIIPGQESTCGTILRVTAVQTVIPARTVRDKDLKCVKCHKSGGVMVRYMNGFIHLEDCAPGTKLLAQPPKFNRLAGYVFNLPEKLRAQVEKRTGKAQRVDEIDADGKETGKTLGYFFLSKIPPEAGKAG